MSDAADKIEIESIASPGQPRWVTGTKYTATGDAFLPVLPTRAPGMTRADATTT